MPVLPFKPSICSLRSPVNGPSGARSSYQKRHSGDTVNDALVRRLPEA